MTKHLLRSTALFLAALSCLAFAVWAYRDVGTVWMLQALRICS